MLIPGAISLEGNASPGAHRSSGSRTSVRSLVFFSIIVFLSISLVGCVNDTTRPDAEPVVDTRGVITSLTEIGTFSPADIQAVVDADSDFDLPPEFQLTVPVTAYRVVYSTVVKTPGMTEPEETLASGALLVPANHTPKSILILLHGTQSKHDLVASVHPANSNEGLIGICVAAGGQHVVCLPDYLGYGVSDIVHPYFNVDANVPSIIDMMMAVKTYCDENEVNQNGLLFLTGYSEGGFFAYHTQRVIEESYADVLPLTAVAPMAGPYDLASTVESIMASSEYIDLAYVGFVFTTFDTTYEWHKLDEIFNEPYAALMPSLYDGSQTWGQILASLPATFDELVNSDFVSRYLAGREPEVTAAFSENTVLEWSSVAPIRFFHGDADMIVPIANAYTAIERLKANDSGSVELVVIEGGTHPTAGGPAVLGMLEWFASFETSVR
jgi:pimeloyl-ACP methyl ester carboxylesterase